MNPKIRNLIFDFLLQIAMCFCLFYGMTSGAFLISRGHYVYLSSHPNAHQWILLGVIFFGIILGWLRYRWDRETFFELEPIRSLQFFLNLRPLCSVGILALFYFVMQFVYLNFMHEGLGTALWDLGFNEQVIWNTAHGKFLIVSVRGGYSVLGEHFYPILALLAPIFWIGNSTWVLFLTQTAASALCIPLIYLIAREVTGSKTFSVALAVAVFFYQPMRSGILFPFHPETFADPFLLIGFYLVLRRHAVWSLLFFGMTLLCKENLTMEIGGIALFLILRRRRIGWAIGLLAILFLAVNTKIIEPHFRFYYFWNKWGYYSHFIHPTVAAWVEVGKAVFSFNTLYFLFMIFAPFLLLPFNAPRWYCLIGPALLIRLLTVFPGFRLITAQYTVGLNALVFIGAAYGFANLEKGMIVRLYQKLFRLGNDCRKRGFVIGGILLMTLILSGKPQLFLFENILWEASAPANQRIVRILESIPASYTVISTQTLLAHLTHRHYIFGYGELPADAPFSGQMRDADLLVVDEGRLQSDEKNVLETYLIRGYKLVFAYEFMKIYASPSFSPQSLDLMVNQWKTFADGKDVPYRKIARRWFKRFVILGSILLVLSIAVRLIRRKKIMRAAAC